MGHGSNVLLAFFVALFFFSIFMFIFSDSKITGHATSGTAVSNVTIIKSISINLLGNLTDAIIFGTLNGTSFTDSNATENYNDTAGATRYRVNVSTDSTVDVDFCLSANTHLTDSVSSDIIGIGNESYNNATTTSATIPLVTGEVPFTASATKAGVEISAGFGVFYRFWLDVPSTTSSGDYNNSVTFAGVETGDSC